MPNMLESGSQWLSDQIDEHLSSNVVYKRGSESVSNVPAGRARTQYEITNDLGHIVQVDSYDFLISSANLLMNGNLITPVVGDRILITQAGITTVYEVLSMGTEQPFRQCDPFGHKLRIHTKLIGTDP